MIFRSEVFRVVAFVPNVQANTNVSGNHVPLHIGSSDTSVHVISGISQH
jgi:hypothetical protein